MFHTPSADARAAVHGRSASHRHRKSENTGIKTEASNRIRYSQRYIVPALAHTRSRHNQRIAVTFKRSA